MNGGVLVTLGERIERLAKLHELRAPPSVLCAEVMLVYKAAFAAHPSQMADAWARWVSASALGEVGVCSLCDSSLPHEMHICKPCLLKESEL